MVTFNSLNSNLIRYIFQYSDTGEMIKIGFLNKKLRNIFNLSKKHMKLFNFTLNIDYNRNFLKNIAKYMNFIKKKFPEVEIKVIREFIALYIKFSNSKNKSIILPLEKFNEDTKLIFNSLNRSNCFFEDMNKKNILFEMKDIKIVKLGKNKFKFRNLPQKYVENKNFTGEIDVSDKDNDELNEVKDFSIKHQNFFNKITFNYYEDNKTILDEILKYNANAIKIIKVNDFLYNFSLFDINSFDKLTIDYGEYDGEHLKPFQKLISEIKDCNLDIDLDFLLKYYGLLKQFSALIHENFRNLVSLSLCYIRCEYDNFDLTIFTNSNKNLKKVYVSRCEQYIHYGPPRDMEWLREEGNFIIMIGHNLVFKIPYNKSLLIGARSILESNLNLENNEDYFKDFTITGNVPFIIEFCDYMAENMTDSNFKKLFSKIKRLRILKTSDLHKINLNKDTKNNINKCLKHMTTIKELTIDFMEDISEFLNLFQFDLLKSLNIFKYRSGLNDLQVLKQLKDIKIKYLRVCFAEFVLNDFKIITMNMEHLVKFKVIHNSKNLYKIKKKDLVRFIIKNKHLNKVEISLLAVSSSDDSFAASGALSIFRCRSHWRLQTGASCMLSEIDEKALLTNLKKTIKELKFEYPQITFLA